MSSRRQSPGLLGKLAVIGDSITAGTGASTAGNRWANLLQAELGYTTLLNQGLSGTVLQNSADAGGSARTNNGRDRFIADVSGLNKGDLLIWAYSGFNDFRYTGAPGTFNLANFIADSRECMNGLFLAGYSATEIIIPSTYWATDALYTTGSTGFTGSNRTVHEQHVQATRDLAREYGMRWADVYSRMRDNGGASLISGDNIHPNNAGHLQIKNALVTAVNENTHPPISGKVLNSPSIGNLAFSWTAASDAAVTNYTAQIGLNDQSLVFTTTQTPTGASTAFTGLASGNYVARVRANYSDGTFSPWSFVTTPVAVGTAQTIVDEAGTAIVDESGTNISA